MFSLWCFRECLRDDIIPYAIKWFTGEAQMEDSDEDDDEDEDDDDDEDNEVCLFLPIVNTSKATSGQQTYCVQLVLLVH